jgi:hypothetical protein
LLYFSLLSGADARLTIKNTNIKVIGELVLALGTEWESNFTEGKLFVKKGRDYSDIWQLCLLLFRSSNKLKPLAPQREKLQASQL